MDLLSDLWTLIKKERMSRAQIRARKAAQQAVYERLLASEVLTDIVGELQATKIAFLDHVAKYHGGQLDLMGEEQLPPPPQQQEQEQVPQVNILDFYRGRAAV
jgi:hypothetical protein